MSYLIESRIDMLKESVHTPFKPDIIFHFWGSPSGSRTTRSLMLSLRLAALEKPIIIDEEF